MKIIISHDVDHLYPSDHLKDLIFPKLWIRSTLEMLKGEIEWSTWYHRLISVFEDRLHRIPEVVEIDKKYHIPSTFFFGMDNILGMSYKKDKALPWIKYIAENKLDVGVHGANFEDEKCVASEYNTFKELTGIEQFGIRMHYVRYNQDTFKYMAKAGYLYDSSKFNKKAVEIEEPYKVGNMWEFPLHIMDGYIMGNGLDQAKEKTKEIISEAHSIEMPYCTILFHDYLFNQKTYPKYQEWYLWLIEYLVSQNLDFISYPNAIAELEQSGKN